MANHRVSLSFIAIACFSISVNCFSYHETYPENDRTLASAEDGLDGIIRKIIRNKQYSPLILGEKETKKHPSFKELETFASKLDTRIEWVSSVAKRVLELPFAPDRMVVKSEDRFVGWFEEYTNPQVIFIDKKTNLSTLIHELRHAIQLGNHSTKIGTPIDLTLQRTKRQLRQKLGDLENNTSLSPQEKKATRKYAIDVVELASEICAHTDDLTLAKVFGSAQDVKSSSQFRKYYWDEFQKTYQGLKESSIYESQFQSFFDAVEEYWRSSR